VVERPLLTDVLFIGCQEIRKKTLQKESKLKAGDPVDPMAIEEARRKLEEYYHEHGFNGARVALLEGDRPEDRRAIFLINEGAKQRVFQTKFIGNTIDTDGRLQTQIKSKHPFLYLFGGEFDRKQIDEDVQRPLARRLAPRCSPAASGQSTAAPLVAPQPPIRHRRRCPAGSSAPMHGARRGGYGPYRFAGRPSLALSAVGRSKHGPGCPRYASERMGVLSGGRRGGVEIPKPPCQDKASWQLLAGKTEAMDKRGYMGRRLDTRRHRVIQ